MPGTLIPKPGEDGGPCADLCAHVECALARLFVDGPCAICEEPLGYEWPVCMESGGTVYHEQCRINEKAAEAALRASAEKTLFGG